MNLVPQSFQITLLGKRFTVTCSEEERTSLEAAAGFLDRKLRDIQSQGRVLGAERCALMAALNITSELLSLQSSRRETPPDIAERLLRMESRIESALADEALAE